MNKNNLIYSGVLLLFFVFIPIFLETVDLQKIYKYYEKTPDFKFTPVTEQIVLIVSAFLIKPAYMIITLLLIIALKNVNNNNIRLLRIAMLYFLTGELFCAINYLFFGEESLFIEYLHSFGMAMGFGYLFYALSDFLDNTVFKFSNIHYKCGLLPVCRNCDKIIKHNCKLKNIYQLAIIYAIIIYTIPLLVNPVNFTYNTTINNTAYVFSHALYIQIFEIRFIPVISIVCSIFALVYIAKKPFPENNSIRWFTIGFGFFIFGIFRLILYRIYAENQTWFVAWEEITELLFVAAIAFLLYRFRNISLIKTKKPTPITLHQ